MSHAKTVNDSTLIKIHAIVEDIDFRMHGLDRYKLYPTENIYNFLLRNRWQFIKIQMSF